MLTARGVLATAALIWCVGFVMGEDAADARGKALRAEQVRRIDALAEQYDRLRAAQEEKYRAALEEAFGAVQEFLSKHGGRDG